MRNYLCAALAACLILASCGPNGASQPDAGTAAPTQSAAADAGPATKPQHVGDFVQTTVASVGPRLEGAPDSGSSIQYANGTSQVAYDVLPGSLIPAPATKCAFA